MNFAAKAFPTFFDHTWAGCGESRGENEVADTEIRTVAIVGTGLIGASWAAQYLASGLDVIATDPAPNAEPTLRKSVDDAWYLLTTIGLAPGASSDHIKTACQILGRPARTNQASGLDV